MTLPLVSPNAPSLTNFAAAPAAVALQKLLADDPQMTAAARADVLALSTDLQTSNVDPAKFAADYNNFAQDVNDGYIDDLKSTDTDVQNFLNALAPLDNFGTPQVGMTVDTSADVNQKFGDAIKSCGYKLDKTWQAVTIDGGKYNVLYCNSGSKNYYPIVCDNAGHVIADTSKYKTGQAHTVTLPDGAVVDFKTANNDDVGKFSVLSGNQYASWDYTDGGVAATVTNLTPALLNTEKTNYANATTQAWNDETRTLGPSGVYWFNGNLGPQRPQPGDNPVPVL